MMLSHTHGSLRRSSSFTMRTSLAAAVALGLTLSGCSPASEPEAAKRENSVTVIVHDSFPNEEFSAAASEATGYDVEVVTAGDGGELTNQLVLTKGAPVADVFFGVDNIFASRVLEHEVVDSVEIPLPERAVDYALTPDGSAPDSADASVAMVPIDLGATCINIDTAWFDQEGIKPPATYEDLTEPTYEGLSVLLDPTSSSTAASFLVGTVEHFGADGFADYWADLVDNGARIEQGWSDAYNGHFTQGGGEGTYPIVLSYSSSPAFTVTEDGSATSTAALLDTCSSQVEYAGVLADAANPEGGGAVLEFMLSRAFQDTIAESMYMYPVDSAATVPEVWDEFAPMPSNQQVHDLDSATIEAEREGWLKTLDEVMSR